MTTVNLADIEIDEPADSTFYRKWTQRMTKALQMTAAVLSMIRDSKNHLISGAIAAGAAKGMISMDQSILNLY